MKLIKIYWLLPIFMQNIAVSIYGLYLKRIRYSGNYNKYLKYYKAKNFNSKLEEEKNQNNEFLRLLNHAFNNSPFYRKLYGNIDNIKSVKDINLLPIVTKDMIRENINQIVTIPQSKGYWSSTGGTTGKSLKVLKSKDDIAKRMARLDYFRSCFGFDNMKMKAARFYGQKIIPPNQKKKIFWRDNYFMKHRIYSSLTLSPENIPYYIDNLNEYKPVVIESYVSCVFEIAKYINLHNVQMSFIPKAIFTTSETVLDVHRNEINKAFKCNVIDQYASQEGAPFITQCNKGHYHENIDTGVFEHIYRNGEMNLIVTSFDSYATPLIRYDIGDTIIESNIQECEIKHPIIKSIGGRQVDYLLTIDNKKINLGDLSDSIKNIPNSVKNIQFIQNSLEIIDIFIVFDSKYYKSNHEELIIKELKDRFGFHMNFIIHKVNSIDREKSGKYRLIKRKI